jgi:hypothetical protein
MDGWFAATFLGFSRATANLDLWIKDASENWKNIRIVLKQMLIADFESIETKEFVPGFAFINQISGFELDVMTSLKGFSQLRFDEYYKLSVVAMVEDTQVRLMHINELIEAKKSSGRPKDFFEIKELEKIPKTTT